MKRSTKRGPKWYSEEEKQVAELLLEFHDSEPNSFIWGSIFGTWGRTKKRSTFVDFPPPSVMPMSLQCGGGALSHDAKTVFKGKVSSLWMPLFLSPAESNQISCASRKKLSLKMNGSKDEYKTKRSTPECGSSKQFHVNVKVNSSDSKTPNEKQKQPQRQQVQTPHISLTMPNHNLTCGSSGFVVSSGLPTTSLQVPFSSSNGLGHVIANVGPPALPDLNLSPEKLSPMGSSEECDEATALRNLNRAIAAEARMRRAFICKQNKIRANSKPPRSS
ncbi:uncharacterized protein LOC109791985 [Cajanus cajan]|uniref:uncharacterized protein LOC109791985 n=1 Tax=Cajanus cajan TaxID=3821 RepID=UPI0010FAE082|nr:uncharacterized protein LOC109791985 [Cajanus cajan]